MSENNTPTSNTFHTYLLINKNTSLVEYRYFFKRKKRLGFPWSDETTYVHFQVPEGKYPEAYSWNGTEVIEDTNYQPPPAIPLERLRIYRVLPLRMDHDEILRQDFSIIGFRKIAPHYDRGRKTKSEYWCVDKEEIIVQKLFSDIRDPDTGTLTGLEVTFNWFCEDNTIGLTKTEVVKNYNKAQAETEERNRRERSIDFLVSEARNTPNEPYITQLTTHYNTQIELYKSRGTLEFSDSINAETDPTINAILTARVPFASDNSFTVPIKESILYQIGTLDEASLLATLQPAS